MTQISLSLLSNPILMHSINLGKEISSNAFINRYGRF